MPRFEDIEYYDSILPVVDCPRGPQLPDLDEELIVTNRGAAGDPAARVVTLPWARPGKIVTIYLRDNAGLRLTPKTAFTTITINGVASIPGGYVQANAQFMALRLAAISPTEWVALDWKGDWNVQIV